MRTKLLKKIRQEIKRNLIFKKNAESCLKVYYKDVLIGYMNWDRHLSKPKSFENYIQGWLSDLPKKAVTENISLCLELACYNYIRNGYPSSKVSKIIEKIIDDRNKKYLKDIYKV